MCATFVGNTCFHLISEFRPHRTNMFWHAMTNVYLRFVFWNACGNICDIYVPTFSAYIAWCHLKVSKKNSKYTCHRGRKFCSCDNSKMSQDSFAIVLHLHTPTRKDMQLQTNNDIQLHPLSNNYIQEQRKHIHSQTNMRTCT